MVVFIASFCAITVCLIAVATIGAATRNTDLFLERIESILVKKGNRDCFICFYLDFLEIPP